MTADVELLPLPASSLQLRHDDATGTEIAPPTPFWNARKMQSYARAVAEHNVKERDAEIAQLRSANEALRASAERWEERCEEEVRQADALREQLREMRAALRDHDQEGE